MNFFPLKGGGPTFFEMPQGRIAEIDRTQVGLAIGQAGVASREQAERFRFFSADPGVSTVFHRKGDSFPAQAPTEQRQFAGSGVVGDRKSVV